MPRYDAHPEDLAARRGDGELSGSRAEESESEGGEDAEHVKVGSS